MLRLLPPRGGETPRRSQASAWDSDASFLHEILDMVDEPCVVLGRVTRARSGTNAHPSSFRLREVWLVQSGFFLSRDSVALLACCADIEVDSLGDGSEVPASADTGGELCVFLLSFS